MLYCIVLYFVIVFIVFYFIFLFCITVPFIAFSCTLTTTHPTPRATTADPGTESRLDGGDAGRWVRPSRFLRQNHQLRHQEGGDR